MPAVIVNIQRQPGANIIQVVDRIKALLPQLQTTLAAYCQVSVLTDRTVDDSRFRKRCPVLADADGGARGDGDLSFSAKSCRHDHPQRGRPAIARRHPRR